MGPPRRARSNSSVSTHSQQHRQRQPQLQEPTPPETPFTQSHLGMSSQSRYLSNMKVVRRRDPSIVSIFDQFSHVCVYHHNGDKWEKQGYEGSMFLYERDSYPPYGLYILNRVGMDDYIQRLYPEDGIGAHGSYLMMRHYPDFTARRLAEARANLPLSKQEGPASKFAPEFAVPNLEQLQDPEKGRSQTVGLWCFATDARESMQDVVLRLHSYIKKNLPYPEEYRYGPDSPPPPNFRSSSRASERSHMRSASSASNTSSIHSISESEEYHAASQPAPSEGGSNGNVSELDKLFAKLGGTGCTSQQMPLQSQTKESTAASLLAGLSSERRPFPPPTSNSVPPTRGLALLDTIFASAPPPPPPSSQFSRGPSRSGAASASLPPSTSIHSQTTHTTQAQSTTFGHTASSQSPLILSPKPTSTALPQVLNQDVISTLLGFPASRAYEGDNEASDDGSISEGGYSVSSTVLDADAEHNMELQAAGSSSGLPLLAVPMGQSEYNGTRNGSGKTLGDVTPRPPLRGFNSDITVVGDLLAAAQTQKHSRASPHLHIPSVAPPRPGDPDTTPTLTSVNGAHSVPKTRSLIPFEAESDLWPYPRAPFVETDSDVIELDFADTSALSDPDAFAREQRSKNRRSQKKGRKEREKDREREREEIEKSWDVPPPVKVVPLSQPQGVASTPAVPVNGKAKHVRLERAGSVASQSSVDGTNAIDADAVHASLLSALAQKKNASSNNLSKNDFIREVLTLIHTDKDFVDTLWQEYASSAK
ncbi:hypothetical protein DFJ58DRAFT_698545 [Suillus subalutaceus]|uniref:uncharacterized protein n=1 Tax=Suillus subalutaceus TaxID=48586 RepID=UPI001B87F23F|nr:uncharacterized protein DFJ58DRAFT_698545 [Suillus subalutaceus]KAG1867296.1 hypothetical protein DFJ58DRAFT_698545 [Suillus subalutaceus]